MVKSKKAKVPKHEYKTGDIVQVSFPGYGMWPAIVDADENLPESILTKKQALVARPDRYVVFFFGSFD
ncbi:hypothetical protein BC940DRAFT_306208 [Gongronella butleri]|nr:hypothetical protein BC940DRAFT_306208 [Gongronella butleri]